MPLSTDPAVAQEIATFAGQGGTAAKLNYDVPLPSAHSGRRLVAIDAGLSDQDWLENQPPAQPAAGGVVPAPAAPAASPPARNLGEHVGFRAGAGGRGDVDTLRAGRVVREQIALSGAGNLPPARVLEAVRTARLTGAPTVVEPHGLTPAPDVDPPPDGPTLEAVLIEAMRDGLFFKLSPKWGGGTIVEPLPLDPPGAPALFLVEVYGISSHLADYGLGRTVRTFSLLPGERSRISVKTWRSRESTRTEGSSIVDSFQSASADRFTNEYERETSDAKSDANTHRWSAGIEAKGGVNLGIVSFGGGVSAGGGGEYHASRQQLARSVSNTMREHTNQSNASREMSVTSSSELVETEGEETLTEREIRNVNMRRTLNFVFRELNQEYVTRFHLRDIRVAYTNGKPGTWREVPLSGLRGLLEELLVPAKVDDAARAVLRQAAVVFDHDDQPVNVLQALQLNADGTNWQLTSPAPRTQPDAQGNPNREYPPPGDSLVYRFAPGPLGAQDGIRVDGVVLSEERITLRTDSVVVEALLGQADALDPYAMTSQKADAEARELENDRERLAQKVIASIGQGDNQAQAYADMFRQEDVVRLALDHQNGDE
jgi:hypothetical protein